MTPTPNPALSPLTAMIDIGGPWRTSIFVGTLACTLYLVNRWRRVIGWAPALLWAYVLGFALFMFEYPSVQYGIYNTAFMATAGQTFAEALLLPLVALSLSRSTVDKVFRFGLPAVVLGEIACVWMGVSGLTVARSFDTAFLALCLPFLTVPLRIMSVTTIVCHHGSTALLIIAAQVFALALSRPRVRLVFLALFPALVGIAYYHSNSPWFDGLERIQKYKKLLQAWLYAENPEVYSVLDPVSWTNVVFGTGPGSFMWLSLLTDKFKPPLFMAMHCDWLQIPFELGAVGLSLVCATVARALRLSWADLQIRTAIFGVCAFAIPYHPCRFWPPAAVITLVFVRALKMKKMQKA